MFCALVHSAAARLVMPAEISSGVRTWRDAVVLGRFNEDSPDGNVDLVECIIVDCRLCRLE